MTDEAEGRGPGDRVELRSIFSRRRRSRMTEEERRRILDELFAEGPALAPFLRRLAVLMAASITIATFGIVSDSAAVVIGAMLVAPLITPITALSVALVMGWPGRQGVQLAVIAGATAGSVALAWLLTRFVPQERLIELPDELLLRTEPTLIDLGIAIAAGAAGAYSTIRPRAGAALPGVAIAVALVPPLAAVGITFELGEGELAEGALLLFLTNLAAIVLSGAVVFLLAGFHADFRSGVDSRRIRLGVITALVAVLAIAYPLGQQSRTIVGEARDEQAASGAIVDWLGDRDLVVAATDLSRHDGRVDVLLDLAGADAPDSPARLAAGLADALGAPVDLTLAIVERRRIRISSGEEPPSP